MSCNEKSTQIRTACWLKIDSHSLQNAPLSNCMEQIVQHPLQEFYRVNRHSFDNPFKSNTALKKKKKNQMLKQSKQKRKIPNLMVNRP